MIIAIDIGGTKTLVAVFDKNAEPIKEERFATPKNTEEFIKELLSTISSLNGKTGTEAISIAAPGLISKEDVILRCGNLPWQNFNIKKELSRYFDCPIFIENDANLGGLGEVLYESSSIPPLFLYLTVSTGIGSGIITNGEINPYLSKSEAGHIVIPTMDGPKTWESFASGSAIKEHFHHLAKELHELEDWEEIAYNLMLGLELIIPLLQPDVIVLGGSIGNFTDKFKSELIKLLKERLPKFIDIPEIIPAKHPHKAVIYGCYYHAIQKLSPSSN